MFKERKSAFGFDRTPEYSAVLAAVQERQPDLLVSEVENLIKAAQKKYEYVFIRNEVTDPARKIVNDRRRLLVLQELDIASADQRVELAELQSRFELIIDAVSGAGVSTDRFFIEKAIEKLLLGRGARSLEEAQEILIQGPIVEGFDMTADPSIENATIQTFLKDTFGIEQLRETKIARIVKDDRYLLFIGENEETKRIQDLLVEEGILPQSEGGFVRIENREQYLHAALRLENVSTPEELQHTYKLHATEGPETYPTIRLHSFDFENMEAFDYLSDRDLSEEDKMRAYILSTISHEVTHHVEAKLLSDDARTEYESIIEEERSFERGYVSDYVQAHKEMYQSNDRVILKEDIAEAVRIFTLNSSFLQQNYPRRHEFIKNYFSSITPDTVIPALHKKQ